MSMGGSLPGARFSDALLRLGTNDWYDTAEFQNSHAYLFGVLGPRIIPGYVYPYLGVPRAVGPADPIRRLRLDLGGLPGELFDLHVGVADPTEGGGSLPWTVRVEGGGRVVEIDVPVVY